MSAEDLRRATAIVIRAALSVVEEEGTVCPTCGLTKYTDMRTRVLRKRLSAEARRLSALAKEIEDAEHAHRG